jgi:hypothetical protein
VHHLRFTSAPAGAQDPAPFDEPTRFGLNYAINVFLRLASNAVPPEEGEITLQAVE